MSVSDIGRAKADGGSDVCITSDPTSLLKDPMLMPTQNREWRRHTAREPPAPNNPGRKGGWRGGTGGGGG